MTTQFLALQGNAGQAVPYERRNAPYTTSVALNPADSKRLKRYEEAWRFYLGQHWSFTREDGEALISSNYIKAVVNKKATWLVGKGMNIRVPDALVEKTKPILEETWKVNNQKVSLMKMAVEGGVTGDACFIITLQEPTSKQLANNPNTKGKIRIRQVGSHQVFPLWNPLNIDELLAVRIITEVSDPTTFVPGDTRTRPITGGLPGAKKVRQYVEDITADSITEGWIGSEMTTRKNSLGEIPFVKIANETVPNEYWGMADVDGLIDIQRELNEKMTDLSDIVNYHAHPITIITGAKARTLEKGPKSLWAGLPAEAKVYTLELGGNLEVSHRYLDKVQQIMFDLAGIPEGSLGRIQSISNTSSAALQVQFQPLIEAIERKAPNYERGIEKINYFILRYWELMRGERFPVDLCKHCGGRIISFQEKTEDGRTIIRKKCYLVNPQTLELMHPDEVKVNVKRQHSFGQETRLMPFGRAKKEFLQRSASYWDPAPMVDLQKEAEAKAEMAEQRAAEEQQKQLELSEAQASSGFEREQQGADAEHQRALELEKTRAAAKPKPKAGA